MMTMRELDKARQIEAPHAVRAQAIDLLRAQARAWGIALPNTTPLVLDFGLGKFESIGLTEIWITNETASGYCGKYLFISGDQTCPMHHHQRKHETFFVVQGRVRMIHGGQEVELCSGDVLAVPSLRKHCFTGVGPALLIELSQPCVIEDNYFEDARIPIGGNYKRQESGKPD